MLPRKARYFLAMLMLSSHVDATFCSLVGSPSSGSPLVWSNNIIFENQTELPDFVGTTVSNAKYQGPFFIGEVEGEDHADDTHMAVVDLICIRLMSKDSIDANCYKVVVGVHVVGFQATFYVTSLLFHDLYVMHEICSVTIPTSIHNMRPFLAVVEDLLPMKHVVKLCQDANSDFIYANKKEGLK